MITLKTRTFSGVVCEQEVFNISEKAKNIKTAASVLRFKTEEEREQHRNLISKRRHARLVNENFSPSSLYSTLTFDDENEVHTFKDARRIRDLYVRRLKYANPDAVIFIYMGRGKNTKRIHFHMLSEGVPEKCLRSQWYYGDVVSVTNLREHNYYDGVDCGKDYTGLANYLFDHWTKEQGGHRWKATKNARKPHKEEPTVAKREYSENKPPRTPKGYKLVEIKITRYGYMYFKYVKIPEKNSMSEISKKVGLFQSL